MAPTAAKPPMRRPARRRRPRWPVCPKCLVHAALEREDASQPPMAASTPNPPASAFEPPSVDQLAAHFPQLEILELLGKGGMGAVYKARQPGLDRLVAVKVLPPELGRDPSFAERFTREARALARLSHPNIVAVYDFGQTGELYYFVMEYVDGVNLRQTIQAGELQPKEALALVPQICDALQFAHEEGIVHRDIKPENILLDKRGRVKIADFGLAKLLRLSAFDLTLTHTQHVMGTFHYMAPEQFARPGEVDHRADIYALGVVFYEMLTGVLPLGRFDLPSQRCAVDARLDEVVLRALDREPDHRYQHATEVKTDVEAVAAHPQMPPPRGPAAPAARAGEGEIDLQEVRDEVAMPAIATIVYGALGLAAAVVTFAVLSVFDIFYSPRGWAPEAIPTFLACALGGGIIAAVVLATGIKMRNLDNYDFAVAGSIVTLLTLFGLWTAIVALPLGIWSLSLLRKSKVRRAFALQQRLWRDDPEIAKRLAARREVAGPAWALVALGVMNVLLPVMVLVTTSFSPILISIPTGLAMMVGGLAMQGLGNYQVARIGAIAALIPCGPAWFVSAPLGLWALRVLRKPHVKSVFARLVEPDAGSSDADELDEQALKAAASKELEDEAARELMKLPALALLVAGCLSLFSAPIGLAIGVAASRLLDSPGGVAWLVFFGIFNGALAALTAPLMILGGLRMKQLESRSLALTGALLALFPWSLGWLIGLPAEIWAILRLSRRDIERAIDRQHASLEGIEAHLGRASALLITTAGLHLACLAGLWVWMYVFIWSPWGFTSWEVPAFVASVTVVLVAAAGVMVWGAVQMRRLQGWGWARAASVVAMLPLSPAVFLGLAAGLYARSLLNKPRLRDWFATRPAKQWE